MYQHCCSSMRTQSKEEPGQWWHWASVTWGSYPPIVAYLLTIFSVTNTRTKDYVCRCCTKANSGSTEECLPCYIPNSSRVLALNPEELVVSPSSIRNRFRREPEFRLRSVWLESPCSPPPLEGETQSSKEGSFTGGFKTVLHHPVMRGNCEEEVTGTLSLLFSYLGENLTDFWQNLKLTF